MFWDIAWGIIIGGAVLGIMSLVGVVLLFLLAGWIDDH